MEKIEIFDTAYGGYGVGRLKDGRVVFVPFTVEGDVAEIEITEEKKSHCFGELVNLVSASEKRGEKYCPLVGECGGCLFGHIEYKHQVEIKVRILKQNLKKGIGYEGDVDVHTAEPLEYRHRATARVREDKIGFYKFMSNDFIEVDNCPIIKKSLYEKMKIFAAENPSEGGYKITAFENEENVALAHIEGELDTDRYKPFGGMKLNREVFGRRFAEFETSCGPVQATHSSFLQGNRYLFKDFQKSFEPGCGEEALELYCGSGYFTRMLEGHYKDIVAVESGRKAVEMGKHLELERTEFICSDCDKFVLSYEGNPDLILADPPRPGLGKNVCKSINKLKPKKVVLISCNPTTLSRDLNRIRESYEVERVKMFDMFANTPHIETVVELRLK